MHVSATNPSCLQSEDIDPELLERERAIFLAQAEESGKDASIMEKMVEGKVKRFLSEVTLVSQGFVKNPDQSIEDLLKENNTSIVDFAREQNQRLMYYFLLTNPQSVSYTHLTLPTKA